MIDEKLYEETIQNRLDDPLFVLAWADDLEEKQDRHARTLRRCLEIGVRFTGDLDLRFACFPEAFGELVTAVEDHGGARGTGWMFFHLSVERAPCLMSVGPVRQWLDGLALVLEMAESRGLLPEGGA